MAPRAALGARASHAGFAGVRCSPTAGRERGEWRGNGEPQGLRDSLARQR